MLLSRAELDRQTWCVCVMTGDLLTGQVHVDQQGALVRWTYNSQNCWELRHREHEWSGLSWDLLDDKTTPQSFALPGELSWRCGLSALYVWGILVPWWNWHLLHQRGGHLGPVVQWCQLRLPGADKKSRRCRWLQLPETSPVDIYVKE